MAELNSHWTAQSVDAFLYRITADYVRQIEDFMAQSPQTSQTELANRLGVSEGRVSQVLNNPGNLTLKKVIEYARALGKKVAIVAYDDDDPENQDGPVNSQIFEACWRKCGTPLDFFDMETVPIAQAVNTQSFGAPQLQMSVAETFQPEKPKWLLFRTSGRYQELRGAGNAET